MSFIERFKQRQVLTPIVEVELNGVTFHIERFAQAEKEGAKLASRAMLRAQGINPEQTEMKYSLGAYFIAFGSILQPHVKDVVLDGKTETNPGTIKAMFEEMTHDELGQLGMRYAEACQADEQSKNALAQSGGNCSAKG